MILFAQSPTLLEWGLIFAGSLAIFLASIPSLLFWRNLALYQVPPLPTEPLGAVSVLIPARNEEQGIGQAIEAIRATRGIDWELIVLDDQSTDRTAAIVDEAAAQDRRIRRASGSPLPSGWCGKQFACWQLAQLASFDTLAFLDADVRLEPEGLARMAGFLQSSGASLVSGVPRQVVLTFWEKALIPLIPFVLLGFLPMAAMRRSKDPAFAAGCGQFFLAKRAGYLQSGGHSAIKQTLHDGLKLPWAFRKAGLATDLADATPLASCRMYTNGTETMNGLMKNATEGLARPGLLLPATLLLLGGQVLPFVVLSASLLNVSILPAFIGLMGIMILYWPRLLGMRRFAQGGTSILVHPLGVAMLVALQWLARWRQWRGKPSSWRGRVYQFPGEKLPMNREPRILRRGEIDGPIGKEPDLLP